MREQNLMKKILFTIIGSYCVLFSGNNYASKNCTDQNLPKNPQHVLSCYLDLPEKENTGWVLDTTTHDSRGITVERYTLTTQLWPKPTMSNSPAVWKQRLVIYRPDILHSDQALLFVNGGTRNPDYARGFARPMELDFAKMAATTQSVVVDLQDVPNQYLTLDDKVERREDGIVAFTWSRYLQDPAHNAYWPLQLPMTKAVVKAMDATQKIVADESGTHIQHFVISGASKRGWVTWLTALSDNRVNAIVPIVIDILDTKKNLQHIYKSYDNHWPMAFMDYTKQNIPAQIDTPEFDSLSKILDPLAYLNCAQCQNYKKRLSIPKYIVSASGDDFFVPDSSTLYIDKLPGENTLRVAPNQSHFISSKVAGEALLSYYATVVFHVTRPQVKWQLNQAGTLSSASMNAKPTRVKLWEAENTRARDFRLAALVSYHSRDLTGVCEASHCTFPVNIAPPVKGWKADFIEATYEHADGQRFVVTTPVYVSGTKLAV
jgi:PhoPQ-activated pathogenicity-related protein